MRKIILLCLALVLALGGLGVGYAAWTDSVIIGGPIETGSLCMHIEEDTYGEVYCPVSGDLPIDRDKNWEGWITGTDPDIISCPEGMMFDEIFCVDKAVGDVVITPVYDNGNIIELEITITDAYPYYLGHFTIEVCNCGTIPLRIDAIIIEQDPSLLIEWRDNLGEQVEPDSCIEASFFVGVTQHLYNDENEELTEQGAELSFNVQVTGIQWNKY